MHSCAYSGFSNLFPKCSLQPRIIDKNVRVKLSPQQVTVICGVLPEIQFTRKVKSELNYFSIVKDSGVVEKGR